MQKRKQPPGLLILGICLLALGGCAGPSALEEDYGRSVRNNIVQQLVNPRAGLDTTPATGMAPKAAANSIDTYDKSFKTEEKKQVELKLTM
jgi:type IV pilus biogenesis protein CpaD/CtpE